MSDIRQKEVCGRLAGWRERRSVTPASTIADASGTAYFLRDFGLVRLNRFIGNPNLIPLKNLRIPPHTRTLLIAR